MKNNNNLRAVAKQENQQLSWSYHSDAKYGSGRQLEKYLVS
jgi:hypothetical protein